MLMFLRNKDNKTVYEVDVFKKEHCVDVSAVVVIRTYSELLMAATPVQREGIVEDFDMLSEIRGWLWEYYRITEKDNTPDEYHHIVDRMRLMLKQIALRYDLYYDDED